MTKKKAVCKHKKFLESLGKPQSNREFWIMLEIFVYLHDGKDYCNCLEQSETTSQKREAEAKKLIGEAIKYMNCFPGCDKIDHITGICTCGYDDLLTRIDKFMKEGE